MCIYYRPTAYIGNLAPKGTIGVTKRQFYRPGYASAGETFNMCVNVSRLPMDRLGPAFDMRGVNIFSH